MRAISTPSIAGQAGDEPRAQGLLVRVQGAGGQGGELVAGLRERDRADDVGRAGLVPGGRRLPDRAVGPHVAHRTSPCEVRRARVEPVATTDQGAGPERCVRLVARERDVVGVGGREREPAVRHQLGAVDGHAGALGVRERDDLVERQRLAGDVGGAGDGQRARSAGGRARRASSAGSRRRCARSAGSSSSGRGRRRVHPGQQVGVVLDVEHEHAASRPGRPRRAG